jgi:hypothetical protein
MSRAAKADRIRDAFLEALKAQGASIETMGDLAADASNSTIRGLFLALGQAGREVYLVRGVGFINVHVRSEPPGWWSILKTVKRDLDVLAIEFGTKCFYVLLVGRNDQHIADGYIATDFSNPPFVRPPGVEETKYTVNEKQHLDARKLLLSVGKVAKVLMVARGVAVTNAP